MITEAQKQTVEKFLQVAVDTGVLSREAVNELLHANEKPEANDLSLLTKKEVAGMLKCSVRQVDKLTEKGRLKKHYIGASSPRFLKDEILSLIFKGKRRR